MKDLSFWQIAAWSCCAGPIVLFIVVGVLGVVFGGITEIIHGHAPATKEDPDL